MTKLADIHKLATDALLCPSYDTDDLRTACVDALTQIADLTRPVSIGDRVRINDQCRPKYVIGCEGTVIAESPRENRVEVQIDEHHVVRLNRRFSNPLCVPLSLLERV